MFIELVEISMANAKRSTDEFEADASMLNYYSRNSVPNASRTDFIRAGAIRTGAARGPRCECNKLPIAKIWKVLKKKERREGPRHPALTEDAF